jgi:hypothetical protein
MSISVDRIFPADWREFFAPHGRVGLGLDVSTTEKNKSNPSALAVTQEVGLDYYVRLLLRWKTNDPAVTTAIVKTTLTLPHGLRARRLCVDATSERFFAANLKRELIGSVVTELVVSSEATEHLGERMNFKCYLGNLLVNTCDDRRLALPDAPWLTADLRSVVRNKGTFDAEVVEDGGHGDCFDAIKQSLHALMTRSGPAQAKAVNVGGGVSGTDTSWLKNPNARKFFNQNRRKINV